MTSRDDGPRFNIGHPAPGRERAGWLLLIFAFSLAPLAWSVQIAAISSIAGVTCLGAAGQAMVRPLSGWEDPAIRLINLGALALAVVALALSTINVIRTWRAAEAPRGGVLSAGEGRAHWMAVGGFFAALLFLVAIAFNTIPVFWNGLCPL